MLVLVYCFPVCWPDCLMFSCLSMYFFLKIKTKPQTHIMIYFHNWKGDSAAFTGLYFAMKYGDFLLLAHFTKLVWKNYTLLFVCSPFNECSISLTFSYWVNRDFLQPLQPNPIKSTKYTIVFTWTCVLWAHLKDSFAQFRTFPWILLLHFSHSAPKGQSEVRD